MTRFVEVRTAVIAPCFSVRSLFGRGQSSPAIDVFVDELDLAKLGFGGVEPGARQEGRPTIRRHLKIYVYGTSIGCSRASAWSGVPAQHQVGLADRPTDARL
jgi:hypothetical protein